MTFRGFLSRFKMFPTVLSIAYRSLKAGIYVRESKYLKFNPKFEKIINQRDPNRGMTVTLDESYTLYTSVLATANLSGAIAEVGVYKGTTAKLICEAKNNRDLYLFDTFDGMPDEKITAHDDWEANTHTDTSLESVQSYLAQYPNITFIPGKFPESILQYPNLYLTQKKFSLVNLDVDLYRSTLDGLEFFYPRLVSGGRLISHNFNLKDSPGANTPGVKQAFLEYFSGSTFRIIEIAETQCLIVKP